MRQSELIIAMGQGNGTNPICDDWVEPIGSYTGCERCGHTKGEHYSRQFYNAGSAGSPNPPEKVT